MKAELPASAPGRAGSGGQGFAGRVLLAALALWGLGMILPGLQRVFEEVGSFGLTVDNDGNVTDVLAPFQSAEESPAARAGIVPGERVDLKAMRCVPPNSPQCATLLTLVGGLGGMQAVLPERRAEFMIVPAAGGEPRTVELEAVPAPLSAAERVVLFLDTLTGTAVILIAFWLVWTRPSWMTWGLFLYVIWINPGQSYMYYALLQQSTAAVFAQEIAEALAEGAAFAGLMIFALRFPHDRTEPRWEKVLRAVPLVAAGMGLLTLAGFLNAFGFRTEKITEVSFLAGLVVDAAVLVILFERRRRLAPQDEQRMRWVIWGCLIGLPTYILAELCQSSGLLRQTLGFAPSQAAIGLLYLPNGVLAYLASQAVWQRRVVSVAVPLRRGTILAALSFALGVPIFLLHEKLSSVGAKFELPEWIWMLVAAPLILLLLGRLHELAVELVDHLFNRRYHIARRELEEASDAIARAGTLEEIDRVLVESVIRSLGLASGAVFRCEGKVFRRTQDSKGWDESAKRILYPEADAAVLSSLEAGSSVRLHPNLWDSMKQAGGVEAACVSVPVRSGIPEATAVALFGPHESGNDIEEDEVEMLDVVAVKAATSSERVVVGLLRQEVEELKARLEETKTGEGKRRTGV